MTVRHNRRLSMSRTGFPLLARGCARSSPGALRGIASRSTKQGSILSDYYRRIDLNAAQPRASLH